MVSRHVKIAPGGGDSGRVPEALGVDVGDSVVIEVKDDELRLRSRQAAIKKVQALVRKYLPDDGRSLADELIAERREEAAREERE